jgi:hypothetical protein
MTKLTLARTMNIARLVCAVVAAGCGKHTLQTSARDGAMSRAETGIEVQGPPDASRDDSADALPSAGCASGWSLCCGQCLSPQAGVCAPCPGDASASNVDAPGDATPVDAATCGAATCAENEYCFSYTGGEPPQCFPRLDGGVCPPNTTEGCPYARGIPDYTCQELIAPPIWTCRSLPSPCPSGDPCTCFCGAPGGMAGCTLSGRNIQCQFP